MRIAMLLCLLLVGCGGDPAPVGPPGPAGKPGVALAITYHCVGIFTIPNVDVLGITHDVYLFGDGSVMTSCDVGGSLIQATGTAMYRAAQSGAAKGSCFTVYDIDSPSAGSWWFEISSDHSTSVATYNDSGSAMNKRTFIMKCGAFQ